MGDGSNFLEILFFALIAGFLVFRLRSVLGRRHGEERQRPNPFAADRSGASLPDNVIPLPDRGRQVGSQEVAGEPFSLAAGLGQIKSADPGFDEKNFSRGVKAAFEMIVSAYAQGDTATLRPLLSDVVYDSFAEEIRRRITMEEKHETHIERVKDVDLLEAKMDGNIAVITAKIISDQMNVTRNSAGSVLDGDPDRLIELTDIWTFARNTRSRDPNWQLVETRTSN
ncbi:MAG: Tim44/TimA family putative adaptor protein [Rhodospirillaceae bacterium]